MRKLHFSYDIGNFDSGITKFSVSSYPSFWKNIQ